MTVITHALALAAKQLSAVKFRRVAGRIASAPAFRCRLDNPPPDTPERAARFTAARPPGGAAAGDRGGRPSVVAGWRDRDVEPVGADLPEARDGEGQLSKDALRSPAPG